MIYLESSSVGNIYVELTVSKKGLCAGFFKALNLKTNKMFFFSQVTKFLKSFHK